MPDNFTANPGSGGVTFASDEIGGVHHPLSKIGYGAPDSFTPMNEKFATEATLAALQVIENAIKTAVEAINTKTTAVNTGAIAGTVTANLGTIAGAATETTVAALLALHKQEDVPAVSGDLGLPMLCVRQLADTTSTDNDGDYTLLKIDEEGRAKVATKPASFTLESGNITASAQTVFSDVRRASNVMIMMNTASLAGHNVTFEGSIDSTNGTDGIWFGIQVVRTNANTIELTSGVLAATPAYAWEASVNGLSFIRVRATAHTSGTATWKFQRGSYATEPIPAAQISGTQPVSGTVTANIGTGALAAGTNAIGDVGIQVRANATGAATVAKVTSAATTNATSVKASAGRVIGWSFTNTAAAIKVVRFYNKASAPTVGTDVPYFVVYLPANAHVNYSLPVGVAFATGIAYAITNAIADLDATAVAANDVLGAIYYA